MIEEELAEWERDLLSGEDAGSFNIAMIEKHEAAGVKLTPDAYDEDEHLGSIAMHDPVPASYYEYGRPRNVLRCKYKMGRIKITDDWKETEFLGNGWRILEIDWGSRSEDSVRVMLEYDPELDTSRVDNL